MSDPTGTLETQLEFWSTLAQWTGLVLPVCSIALVFLLVGRAWRHWKWMLVLLVLSTGSVAILWKMMQLQGKRSAITEAEIEANNAAWRAGSATGASAQQLWFDAVLAGQTEQLAGRLAATGQSIDQRDSDSGFNALHLAVWAGQAAVVEHLLALGADPWLTAGPAQTAFDLAGLRQDPAVLAALDGYDEALRLPLEAAGRDASVLAVTRATLATLRTAGGSTALQSAVPPVELHPANIEWPAALATLVEPLSLRGWLAPRRARVSMQLPSGAMLESDLWRGVQVEAAAHGGQAVPWSVHLIRLQPAPGQSKTMGS